MLRLLKQKTSRLSGLTLHYSILIYSLILYFLKYRRYNALPYIKRGFEDHRACIDADNTPYEVIFKRLLDSYSKAKEEQQNLDRPYRVGQMWQGVLDGRCRELVSYLREQDTSRLRALLDNFHREKFTVTSGGASDDYFAMKNPLYKYQFINTWYKYYNLYRDIADGNPELSYPLVGNPAGLYHNGQIIPIDAIRYHYYAGEILALLEDVNNPVICEIGGGLGGQAYKIVSNSNCATTYILLDIPEMLVISSYFLMSALPQKRYLLYGECPVDSGKLDQYDIVLMPNFVLPQFGNDTVDLFFNSCSFSEMDSVTVREYIDQIERICGRYFMHVNHDARFVWHDGEEEVVNVPASQIRLDSRRFKRIYKHPRVFARMEDRVFYHTHKAGHFAFLYERTRVL